MQQPVSHHAANQYPQAAYDERDTGYGLQGDQRTDEEPRRDRRLPMVLLTVGAMALFAGGLWFAYLQGTRQAAAPAGGEGVPLIRADDRPTKVKPEQPGGMPIPDQNVSLYGDKPGKPSTEKLLPPPEKPMARPTAPREATPPAPAIAPPAAAEAAPAAPSAAVKPSAKAATEAKPPAQPKPAAAPKPAATTAAAGGGPVQVRLGSVRTPDAARDEWAKLKRENGDLLGSLKANAVAVDLGEKGVYYRIVAGPFADAATAERLCGEMKKRNRGCILAR